MAVSIDWGNTDIILIPKADLTLVSGTLYELDTDAFRLELKSLEDDPAGMPHPKTHVRNAAVTVAGTTFAQTIEILPPYSVEFEDGQYSVRLTGSNNNIFDVESGILVQNQVQVIPNNSAGLIGASQMLEMWKLMGLDASNPAVLSGDGETSKTVSVGGMTVTFTPNSITRT